MSAARTIACPTCKGTGRVNTENGCCQTCGGRGYLLAPEPEPEPRKRVMVGGSDHTTMVDANLVPLSPTPEPEPSEREIEAGAKALEEWQNSNGGSLEDLFSDDRVNMDAIRAMRHAEQCQQAKAVLLAAARAARQTGGES